MVAKADDEWVEAGSASMVKGYDVVTTGTLKSGLTPTFRYYSNEARTVPIDNLRSLPVNYVVYVKVTTNGNENYKAFTDSTITFTVLDIASFNISGGTFISGTITMNVDNYSDYQWAAYHINADDRIFYDITTKVVNVEVDAYSGDEKCRIEVWTNPQGSEPVCFVEVSC